MEKIRIDKFISVACGISRNDAKMLLRKGSVCVNGRPIKKSEEKVCETDEVSVNGQQAVYKRFVYLVMNKPKGVLSASNDKRVKTVIDIVPEQYRHYDLFPVGRLDKDTTGLLLITNDGDFAHRIISPKSNTDKLYHVLLDGKVTDEHVAAFEKGVILSDGARCMPAKLKVLSGFEALITIREGKYHQVKRMFGTVGLGVNELKRLSIGGLQLPDDIKAGECRELTEDELGKLCR